MNFEGKVAVITGSSAGIGAEAAKKITAMGGRVTINYSKSKEAAEEVAHECSHLGEPPLIIKSAPPPYPLTKSPGQVHPPSQIMCPFNPCAASAHSITQDKIGIPTPVFFLVVHTLPGPIPHFIMSAPFNKSSSVISDVATEPAIIIFSGNRL